MSVLGLILSFFSYLRSPIVWFPLFMSCTILGGMTILNFFWPGWPYMPYAKRKLKKNKLKNYVLRPIKGVLKIVLKKNIKSLITMKKTSSLCNVPLLKNPENPPKNHF